MRHATARRLFTFLSTHGRLPTPLPDKTITFTRRNASSPSTAMARRPHMRAIGVARHSIRTPLYFQRHIYRINNDAARGKNMMMIR